MDKAKHAVSSFLSRTGHHDTTVHESVAPSVKKETVKEQRREETQIAKEREIHQDHYHTTIQPIQDREVLPEQHHHQQVDVEHRTFDHRDHSQTQGKLQNQAAQFKDESVRAAAHHTTSTAVPEAAGDHVHHHIHETIQPVVHKEIIEPHVIHTTVPIHETHYNEAKHHTATALPAISMDEFQKQGTSLNGRDTKHDHFKGEPTTFENTVSNSGSHHGASHQHGATSNLTGGGVGSGQSTSHRSGDAGIDRNVANGTQKSKPSLMDKLNPKKDADGDGKRGFMS